MGVELHRGSLSGRRGPVLIAARSDVAWSSGLDGDCEGGRVGLVLSYPVGPATAAVEDSSVSHSPGGWKTVNI